MIGQLSSVVLDGPDPRALAQESMVAALAPGTGFLAAENARARS